MLSGYFKPYSTIQLEFIELQTVESLVLGSAHPSFLVPTLTPHYYNRIYIDTLLVQIHINLQSISTIHLFLSYQYEYKLLHHQIVFYRTLRSKTDGICSKYVFSPQPHELFFSLRIWNPGHGLLLSNTKCIGFAS